MAKRKRNRRPTIAQLREQIENLRPRSELLKQRALGRLNGQVIVHRNRKRAKDARNDPVRRAQEEG